MAVLLDLILGVALGALLAWASSVALAAAIMAAKGWRWREGFVIATRFPALGLLVAAKFPPKPPGELSIDLESVKLEKIPEDER